MPKMDGSTEASVRNKIFKQFRSRVDRGRGAVMVASRCADESVNLPCDYVVCFSTCNRSMNERKQEEGRAARAKGLRIDGRSSYLPRRAYSLISTNGGPSGLGELDFAMARRYEWEHPGETMLVLEGDCEVTAAGRELAALIERDFDAPSRLRAKRASDVRKRPR